MNNDKVHFVAMDWNDTREGVRMKEYCEGGLEIDFDGEVITFTTGDGIFIPQGRASRRRSPSIRPGTRLLMAEDV